MGNNRCFPAGMRLSNPESLPPFFRIDPKSLLYMLLLNDDGYPVRMIGNPEILIPRIPHGRSYKFQSSGRSGRKRVDCHELYAPFIRLTIEI
jgi:hypothetical protein